MQKKGFSFFNFIIYFRKRRAWQHVFLTQGIPGPAEGAHFLYGNLNAFQKSVSVTFQFPHVEKACLK